jgi:hypothetical protein
VHVHVVTHCQRDGRTDGQTEGGKEVGREGGREGGRDEGLGERADRRESLRKGGIDRVEGDLKYGPSNLGVYSDSSSAI